MSDGFGHWLAGTFWVRLTADSDPVRAAVVASANSSKKTLIDPPVPKSVVKRPPYNSALDTLQSGAPETPKDTIGPRTGVPVRFVIVR